MKKFSDPEPDRSLPRWKVVCRELGVTLVGNTLVILRQEARAAVNEKGDQKIDYRFSTFDNGEFTGAFVVTSSRGLRGFQRGRLRHAS